MTAGCEFLQFFLASEFKNPISNREFWLSGVPSPSPRSLKIYDLALKTQNNLWAAIT